MLDFFIIGFPKCGTTALLYAFRKNNETVIPAVEYCGLSNNRDSHQQAVDKLTNVLESTVTAAAAATTSPPIENVKLGIKCPMAVRNILGIERLAMQRQFNDKLTNTGTVLIVGLRHPVLFFQSFYNYRITEMHNNNNVVNVPPPEYLVGNRSWKSVSTDLAQFELYLMQLGKTSLSNRELVRMASKGLSVSRPLRDFRVFVYDVGQLDDGDETRAATFREDLRRFLGLTHPIAPFTRENSNRAAHYPEHMDICDARFDTLRDLLLAQAKETQRWIRERFVVESDDVIAGGRSHFLELISQWNRDPCASGH